MATLQKILHIGAFANDGTGDTLRDAADKINYNFYHLFNRLEISPDFTGDQLIDDKFAVVIITNSGVRLTLGAGINKGDMKQFVNSSSGQVSISATFLGGTLLTIEASSACQIIWIGDKWVLFNNNASIT